jgi:putative membrane protein
MTVAAPARVAVSVVPALLAVAVAAQIGYPLVAGTTRDALTVVIVVVVAAAALCSAATTRGRPALVVLALSTVIGGFAVEVLGVHTGFPFGRYRYDGSLGPTLFGVPLVIACAWPMLAWPSAVAARHLTHSYPARVLLGAWALTTWDVFLDPQMVAAGHWHWLHPAPHLPGVPTVPLTDYVGWFAVALLVSAVLQRLLNATSIGDRWPLMFYVWTWASSTLALLAFLGLAAAALWGCAAMGTVAIPVLRVLARRS